MNVPTLKPRESITSYAPYKNGWYHLNLHAVEVRYAKASGDPYLSLDFKINHQTGNRRVWSNLPISTTTEKGKKFLENIFAQLVYALDPEITPEQMKGKSHEDIMVSYLGRTVIGYLQTKDGKMECAAFDYNQEHTDDAAPRAESMAPPRPRLVPAPKPQAVGDELDNLDDDDIPF